MLPTDHQFNSKKNWREFPLGGPSPWKKNLAKEGKCFRQTTNSIQKKIGESSPWGGPPPGKRIWQRRGNASDRPPIEFFKKRRESPRGGARPLEKELAKEGTCFRQTTN